MTSAQLWAVWRRHIEFDFSRWKATSRRIRSKAPSTMAAMSILDWCVEEELFWWTDVDDPLVVVDFWSGFPAIGHPRLKMTKRSRKLDIFFSKIKFCFDLGGCFDVYNSSLAGNSNRSNITRSFWIKKEINFSYPSYGPIHLSEWKMIQTVYMNETMQYYCSVRVYFSGW